MLGLVMGILASLILMGSTQAAPSSKLWPKWNKSNSNSSITINHQIWDSLLKKYLNSNHASGIYRFNYKKFNTADKSKLNTYINTLENIVITQADKKQQLSYWINLYNALTVKVILDHYPTKSILDIKISPGLLSFGPWDRKLIKIEGEELSLNDIEHRILRPIWNDNRIHYVLNCGSLGCPNLAEKAYTPSNTAQLLDSQAKSFINHQRGVNFDKGKLVLSKIYKWYAKDFGNNEPNLLKHLEMYAQPELAKQINTYKGSIKYDYDWNLNQ
ncbi:hypothetical protein BVY03_03965 [bacterium K02(2017)]|nr:hypothetical protein BVY03_03965 [bacterium K02(2017)]